MLFGVAVRIAIAGEKEIKAENDGQRGEPYWMVIPVDLSCPGIRSLQRAPYAGPAKTKADKEKEQPGQPVFQLAKQKRLTATMPAGLP